VNLSDPTKFLDCTVAEGARDREKRYYEFHRSRGVRLRRKYTPAGQAVKIVKRTGGK